MTSALATLGHPPHRHLLHCNMSLPDFSIWVQLTSSLDFPGVLLVSHPLPLVMQKMQEMRIQSLGGEDPLEEEMATHSIILAWETLWTEKPGGLQSMGLRRVGHDWATDRVCVVSSLGRHFGTFLEIISNLSLSNRYGKIWFFFEPDFGHF